MRVVRINIQVDTGNVTLRSLPPESISPFFNLEMTGRGGGQEEWTVECELDNIPKKLPIPLRSQRVQPYVYVDVPGYGKVELSTDLDDFARGFFEKIRPVLVALARVSKD